MDTESISASYARALIELAQEKGLVTELGDEVACVEEAIRLWPAFGDFLATPKIATEKKIEVVERTFSGELSQTFMDFIRTVISHHRGMLFREIAELFRREVDILTGRTRAFVKTAVEMDDRARESLVSVLKKKLNMEVVLEERVDPAILGGFKVRVGDSLLDATLASRLVKLRKLMEEGKLLDEVIYED
jgi:F-type H+-transporting ATPase subunit delta